MDIFNPTVIPTNLVKTVKTQAFTASGTYTPTTGMLYCIVEAVGGGGGGGGAKGAAAITAGAGGGGSGAYARKVLTAAQVGASQVVTIGANGTGGNTTPTNGTAGGDTSLGTLCIATRGGGGINATTATPASFGGTFGGSVGDITILGDQGNFGFGASIVTVSPFGGNGGHSYFGSGTQSNKAAPGGLALSNPANANTGDGGSGGGSGQATGQAGGDGGTGYIFITEFCSQ